MCHAHPISSVLSNVTFILAFDSSGCVLGERMSDAEICVVTFSSLTFILKYGVIFYFRFVSHAFH